MHAAVDIECLDVDVVTVRDVSKRGCWKSPRELFHVGSHPKL